MTKVPILVVGIIVVLLCVRLVVQKRRSSLRIVSADDFAKAQQALNSIVVKTATIKRILSDEDCEFVSGTGSDELRRLFLRERKMLVIHWFRTIQKQVAYLMDIHLRLAGAASPTPESELKLGIQFATFMIASNCLVAIFWLFGPFNARKTLGCMITGVEGFFGTFRDRLQVINPTQLHARSQSLVH